MGFWGCPKPKTFPVRAKQSHITERGIASSPKMLLATLAPHCVRCSAGVTESCVFDIRHSPDLK